jgi:hypothetical protein
MSNEKQGITNATSPDSRDGATVNPRVRLWFGLGLLGYVICYAVLSSLGQWQMVTSGKHYYSKTGLGVIDTREWQPKGLLFRRWKDFDGKMRTEGNFCGYVYSPLLFLDRACVHRTESSYQE